jgi:hypothetical protein
VITVQGRRYVQTKALPKGKSWLRYEDKKTHPLLDGVWIKIADPVMLKAVLATTEDKRSSGVYDGTRTTLYQGTITLGELRKASSPTFPLGLEERPTRKEAKVKVSWQLWLGEDQLVRRTWASWTDVHSYVVDAHLTNWGTQTDITPPPANEVMTPEDIAMG